MHEMKLQLFAEAVKGKKIVWLYRPHENLATEDGAVLAFTTEDSFSIGADADSTQTKDGVIRTPSEPALEKTGTSIFMKGDPTIDEYKDACLNNKLMDIWRADLTQPVVGAGDNKFKGTYYQGYLTSFEETANAEDFVEISLTFGINGKGADGSVTVTTEQQEAASYVFIDTPKGSTGSTGATGSTAA